LTKIKEVILATKNQNKVKEIKKILKESNFKNIKIKTLLDFPDIPEISEDAKTFYGNALLKAKTVWRYLKKPVLAEDSGLCVHALNGMPGIRSARFAGPDGTQKKLISKLLLMMKNKKDRRAFFKAVVVMILPSGKIISGSGTVKGYISDKPKGNKGFGYDPVFYYPPLKKTFAELKTEEKNRLSHRRKALERVFNKLRTFLKKD